uniref:Autophagy-related protein 13 n=1 Tax=Steinernema glaseri TaxID=37863 RepID=A0A1I7Y4M9_9BILA
MGQQEFQKFTKYFCTRLIQSVVQARTGEEVCHECVENPETSDWFNLRVDELGEITAYIRSSVQGFPPQSNCLNLDFFLYTAFGQYFPLESWRVTVDDKKCDPQVSIRGGFYHQLGTLLKSAVAAARVTPLYRYYVKRQGANTFVAFYRIYNGPSEIDLGAEKVETRLGCLPSPFGTLCVDLVYRTTMELTSEHQMSKSAYCANVGTLERGRLGSASCPRFIPLSAKVPSDLKRPSEAELGSPVDETVVAFSVSPNSPTDSGNKKISFHMGQSSSSEDVTSCGLDRKCRNACDTSELSTASSLRRSKKKKPIGSFPFASLLSISDSPPRCRRHSEKIDRHGMSGVGLFEKISESEERTANCGFDQPYSSSLRHCSTVPTACNLMVKQEPFAPLKEGSNESEESDSLEDDNSAIQMLSFSTTEDLGTDLKELVQRCRDAPSSLQFLNKEQNYSTLPTLLSTYEDQKNRFDEFVARVRAQSCCDDD